VLAARGAHVILGCRDPLKGEAAQRQIGGKHRGASIDLSSLASVHEAAEAWQGARSTSWSTTPASWRCTPHECPSTATSCSSRPMCSGRSRSPASCSTAHRPGRLGRARDAPGRQARTRRPQLPAPPLQRVAGLFREQARRPHARLRVAAPAQLRRQSAVRSYAAHPGYAQTGLSAARTAASLPLAVGTNWRPCSRSRRSADAGCLADCCMPQPSPTCPPGCYVGPVRVR
jgi:hypothetical protein